MLPALVFSQEDIERYKVYPTENIYTSLLLDTANGRIWQLQIGVGNTDRMKTVLSDFKRSKWTLEEITELTKSEMESWTELINSQTESWQEEYNSKPDSIDSIVSVEGEIYWKPWSVEEKIEAVYNIGQNGKYKLYPTGNMYNFIMVDVELGRTWQVQWSTKENKRLVIPIY